MAIPFITALQLLAEKRFSNGLQFLATYTWSKSIDNSSQADDNVTWLGSFSGLQDPNKPWLERSLSTFDIPHVHSVQLQLRSPVRTRPRIPRQYAAMGRIVIGGWKTNGIWRIADGRPLTFDVEDGNPIPTYGTQRPNIVGTPKRNHGSNWVDNYFVDNRSSSVQPISRWATLPVRWAAFAARGPSPPTCR